MLLSSTKHSCSRYQRIGFAVGFPVHVCTTVGLPGWQSWLTVLAVSMFILTVLEFPRVHWLWSRDPHVQHISASCFLGINACCIYVGGCWLFLCLVWRVESFFFVQTCILSCSQVCWASPCNEANAQCRCLWGKTTYLCDMVTTIRLGLIFYYTNMLIGNAPILIETSPTDSMCAHIYARIRFFSCGSQVLW